MGYHRFLIILCRHHHLRGFPIKFTARADSDIMLGIFLLKVSAINFAALHGIDDRESFSTNWFADDCAYVLGFKL